MNWIELPNNERMTIVNNTLVAFPRLSRNVIEKDWWVTMILKALFESSCSEYLSFKGGTSLAKWGVIERFSEDIDIAFDKSKWGLAGANKSQRDNIRKRTRKFIRESLVPELDASLRRMGAEDFEVEFKEHKDSDKDPSVVFVPYKSLYGQDEYVPSRVKIEFSSRSLREPVDKIHIQSYFSLVYPEVFKEYEFEVTAVAPTRTFLEKIFLLHEELQKEHTRTFRMTRHLYDLERLMDTKYGMQALADSKMYVEIVKHRSIYNAIRGIDYRTHHPSTINIIPQGEILEKWRNDYDEMQNSFIYGDSLPFDELMQRISELQERIRNIQIDNELWTDNLGV